MRERAIQQNNGESDVKSKRTSFTIVFLLAFFTSLYALVHWNVVPEHINGARIVTGFPSADDGVSTAEAQDNDKGVLGEDEVQNLYFDEDSILPTRVLIDKIGVDSVILNPTSTDIGILDDALRSGVVHYPGSGTLEDDSNLFLFGHSAENIPVVSNAAYKAFDGLENLNIGDKIRVQSDDMEHIYLVTQVSLTTADEALVEFERGVKMLTLSTCNTFGEPIDRFVVEASFVESYSIARN
jgi:LPXTG-site transpeptidase (sortase) family protein